MLLVTLFITLTESKLEHRGRQHFLVLLLLFDFLLFHEKVSQVSQGCPNLTRVALNFWISSPRQSAGVIGVHECIFAVVCFTFALLRMEAPNLLQTEIQPQIPLSCIFSLTSKLFQNFNFRNYVLGTLGIEGSCIALLTFGSDGNRYLPQPWIHWAPLRQLQHHAWMITKVGTQAVGRACRRDS